mgnify:FL=1
MWICWKFCTFKGDILKISYNNQGFNSSLLKGLGVIKNKKGFKVTNLDTYEEKYRNGYGIKYPEGHIIRIMKNILPELIQKMPIEGNFLDFGCGNGVHSKFFADEGFSVFGVDISKRAIELAKNNNKEYQENFFTIKDNKFDNKFDVILANQSLYYLSNEELQLVLKQFNDLLNDDGIVIFTMMSMKNCSYNYIDEHLDNGLSKVILSGRLNETTYINFTKDIEDLKNKFSIFSHLFSGIYDMTLIEGSSEHMYYIGKKQ